MKTLIFYLMIALCIPACLEASILTPATWGTISREYNWMEVDNRLLAGNSSTSPEEFQGVMEFDFRGINSTVPTTYLNLKTDRVGNALDFELYGYIANLQVTRDDLNVGIKLLSSFNISASGVYSFDVTDFINGNSSADYLGFNIRPAIGGGFPQDTTWGFGEVGLGDLGEVKPLGSGGTPVPTPPALWLFGSAFIGLLSIRKNIFRYP